MKATAAPTVAESVPRIWCGSQTFFI